MFIPPKKCIGPSQLSSVLGFNKFLDRETLKKRLQHGYIDDRSAAERSCMDFGIRKEEIARTFYQRWLRKERMSLNGDLRVLPADFARDGTRRLVGKADGLVGTDGGVEFKCHLDKDPLKTIPNYYLCQIVAYMWLYRRQWWDFVSCGFQGDQLTKCNITRIYWKNHRSTWENEWYPQIELFIHETWSI